MPSKFGEVAEVKEDIYSQNRALAVFLRDKSCGLGISLVPRAPSAVIPWESGLDQQLKNIYIQRTCH